MAESWYHVAGNENAQSYVDLDSLRTFGDKIVGETLSVYSAPLSDGVTWATRIRQEMSCTENYFRTLEYSYFDENGALTDTEASETMNVRKVPAPHSINETIMDFICYRRGGVAVANPFADAAIRF